MLAVAAIAVIHFATREQVPEGAIAIHVGENVKYVDPAKLPVVPVQGTVINGKGKEIAVDEQGTELINVLRAAKIDPASVSSVSLTAADEFSATLTGEEINEKGKAYLVPTEEGIKLVVFGDENMKRNVKNIVSVSVE